VIDPTSGVAWAAHVAGFVFGVLVGLVLKATGGGRPNRRTPVYA
jgi:membrane associated rhomboid family serine protease